MMIQTAPAGLHIVTNGTQFCSGPGSFILCSERIAKSALPDGDLALHAVILFGGDGFRLRHLGRNVEEFIR